jgi:hypothetical protein
MPDRANLVIYQGDDYSAVVTVLNGTGPADLTGYTAQAQIRPGPADRFRQIIAELGTSIDTANSLIYLSLPSATTTPLAGAFYWDLQLTAPGGTVTTILAGVATITPEITRETTR